jgi:predicted ArsR family transcriptional regulator
VVALLAEKGRRDLYEFVRGAAGPVTRDEAAEHAGISRRLAAFHLDKLVRGGLLRARTDLPAAGVGRRPKRYESSTVEVTMSIPTRRYDLLAEVLLQAMDTALDPNGGPGLVPAVAAQVTASARQVAYERGLQAGAAKRETGRAGRLGPERALTAAASLLETCGYEPIRTAPRHVVLRNCPFRRLADRSREMVCGINHAFCAGVIAALAAPGVSAQLAPTEGHCCVQLRG